MSPEDEIDALELKLPPAPQPGGVYKPFLIVGNLVYVSGHGPVKHDGSLMKGRIGEELTLEEGKEAAAQTGLAILATLKENLGWLSRVKRVVKIFGMVNCVPDFFDQPAVINGCSELFGRVFGSDNGIGVRSAVGMNSLPGNIPVEIEAVFEVGE